jgi:hypothetical protein
MTASATHILLLKPKATLTNAFKSNQKQRFQRQKNQATNFFRTAFQPRKDKQKRGGD